MNSNRKGPCPKQGSTENAIASEHGDAKTLLGRGEIGFRVQGDARPAASNCGIQSGNPGQKDTVTPASIVVLPANAALDARDRFVRERINAKARPILEAFARRRAIPLEGLQEAIDGTTPLTHPEIVHRLGGGLHAEEMRSVIASNADHSLVPLDVRAGVARMMAQSLAAPPPAAMQTAFPDWSKPLAPHGRHLQTWHPEGAAAWLDGFPPSEVLPHPLDTWDAATAALWLNDRETLSSDLPREGALDGTVVAFEARGPWLPSLKVLHTLDEIELEELAYRVFVERLRREVMPYYVSERRIHVQRAVELVTFGYQTLQAARRSVRTHDLQRVRYFDRVFDDDNEWINDLCCRIMAAYAWPVGFSELELWSDLPDLYEAPL